MTKTKYIALSAATLALATAAALLINYLSNATPAFSEAEEHMLFPQMYENVFEEGGARIAQKTAYFEEGGEFSIFRIGFAEGSDAADYTYEIPVSGTDMLFGWQNYDKTPYEWEVSDAGGFSEPPKATLFIETSAENIIVSIPALYYERSAHKTLECLPEYERPVVISETEGGYVLRMSFKRMEGVFGEFWYYKSDEALIEWNEELKALWIRQDLHKNRRFSYDGYYYRTYQNYVPYSENGFFRNAANYTGAQILKSRGSAVNMGRAMTKICLQNQNSYGFWETGPKSEWLYSDYGIEYDFYDTRFSTDFARSLVYGYSAFGDAEFLDGARRYADFLVSYANAYGYTGGAIGDGVLVPDYWSETMTKRPHASLNHQLSEINFLLELYAVTKEEKHKQCADRLLAGIENTARQWILPDGNLKYALMYDETKTQLNDYPFLTYNDLYDTSQLLAEQGESSAAITALMASKRAWMDENGVTGYKK